MRLFESFLLLLSYFSIFWTTSIALIERKTAARLAKNKIKNDSSILVQVQSFLRVDERSCLGRDDFFQEKS